MNKKFAAEKMMVFLFLAMAFLGACSGPSTNRPLYQPHSGTQTFTSVENELRTAPLVCDSPAACPENVGMVYSAENLNSFPKPQVLKCTGFLVQDNIVATNSHCVPDIIKQNQMSCAGLMAIKFVRRGPGQPDVFPCQRLLNYSQFDPTKILPDYAFFEIARTGIAPLGISQTGIPNRQQLRLVKVVPWEKGARLQSEACVSALNSALNFSSASAWSKTSAAINCHSAEGNSGSPVLDKKNQVVGILQSAYKEKQLQEMKRLAPVGTQMPDKLIPNIILTNLACVPHPVNGRYEREKCAAAENLRITDCISLDSSTASAGELKVNKEWTDRLPRNFIYEFQTDMAQELKRAVPRCVRVESPNKLLVVYPGEVKYAMPLHFDAEFRLLRKTNFFKKSESNYQISLTKSGDRWKGQLSLLSTGNGLGSAAQSVIDIPSCTSADESQGSMTRRIEGSPQALVKKDTSLCGKD